MEKTQLNYGVYKIDPKDITNFSYKLFGAMILLFIVISSFLFMSFDSSLIIKGLVIILIFGGWLTYRLNGFLANQHYSLDESSISFYVPTSSPDNYLSFKKINYKNIASIDKSFGTYKITSKRNNDETIKIPTLWSQSKQLVEFVKSQMNE